MENDNRPIEIGHVEPKPLSPSQAIFGAPFDFKEWKEAAEVLGLGILLPGLTIIWGYLFFVIHFTPAGITEWFPAFYASFNLTATALICLAVVVLVGGFITTVVHLGFLPTRNQAGSRGFRLNGAVNFFVFWDLIALIVTIICAWLFHEVSKLPWSHRLGILAGNLGIAYMAFWLWDLHLPLNEDPMRGRIWNRAKPILCKVLFFTSFLVLTSVWTHSISRQILDRALVMSGVRSDWTRLRIAGTHLEPLRRKCKGKLELALSKEGDQNFIYIEQGRVLFQRIGTDALLEVRLPDEKRLRYRLPSVDFREVGYLDESVVQD